MATLNIDGQNIQVDDSFLQLSHDQQSATVDEIAASLKTKPSVGMGEDAAKSIASGLGNATIGTLGSLGDIRSLASSGVDALGKKLGVDLSPVKTAASMASKVIPGAGLIANAPTSQDIKSTVTDPIVSPDYQPQYESGRLLKKGAEFAPNMLMGGPEGALARFATNVAAPAIGSEIGEHVAGPLGGVAGALVGAGGATAAAQKFKAMAAARMAEKSAPTADQLYNSADTGFNQARDMNVVVKPDFATNAAADMRDAVKTYDPDLVKGIHGAADRLEALASPGAVELNGVENIRKQLVSLKTNPDASIRSAAKDAIESLQKSQIALTPADTLSGDAGAYSKLIKDAVGNWAAMKRSNTVTGKIDLANLNAGTAGSGANIDNNTRQAFKQLARPINNTNTPIWKKLGFSNQEGAAIEQAAVGTKLGNTARYLGKYAPTGVTSAALSGDIGLHAGGPIGAVALPAAGYIAKKIGDLSTKRAVAAIDSLVRSRSPLAAHVAAQLPPQIIQQLPAKTTRLLRTMVLADPTLSQQVSQPVGQSNTN